MKSKEILNSIRLTNPVHLLAVGFGSGLIHPAPGSWGSLAGLLLGMIWLQFFSVKTLVILTALCFVLGCYLCQKTAADMGVHDHGSIVWDEFVGIWLVLCAVPEINWIWFILAFLSFRFFDILKPYPIKYWDQKLENGFGIMIDDVLAALYSIGFLWLLVLITNMTGSYL